MDVREKLVGLLEEIPHPQRLYPDLYVDRIIAKGATVQECIARPIEEWGEDYGDVLWWKFPIEEPPYVGSPLDEKWPAYHTHWTPIMMPQPPKGD